MTAIGMLIGIMILVCYVALFWYLYKTVRIIWEFSTLMAVAALFIPIIVHIVFYLLPKQGFGRYEAKLFKRYFLSFAAIGVLGILIAILIPLYKDIEATEEGTAEVEAGYVADIDQSFYPSLVHEESQSTDEEVLEIHLQTIYDAHPDAQALVNSRVFSIWIQSLKPSYNANFNRILAEGNAKEVIYMLNEFKKYLNQQEYEREVQQQKIQRMKQAAAVEINKFPEKTTEQRMDKHNKTMQVLMDNKAQEKKMELMRQGYNTQQAEEYAEEWKRQQINNY